MTKPIESEHRLLTTVAWQIDGMTEYALEGSVFIGGAVIQWLRDSLGVIEASSDVEGFAASVPDNGGVYFVPAFAGLGTPHWDQEARGLIIGLTRGRARATSPGRRSNRSLSKRPICLTAMQADSGDQYLSNCVLTVGHPKRTVLQFQADILQIPVIRSKIAETTALGAAYLAGLAVRYLVVKNRACRTLAGRRTFEPNMSRMPQRGCMNDGTKPSAVRSPGTSTSCRLYQRARRPQPSLAVERKRKK